MLSDISGSDKLIVVQDPFSGLKFIYRVDHESSNLDAAALTEQDGSAFNGKQSVEINAMTYKLGTADNAMKLLRGKTHWIQDKGSVLSVLLQNAASRKTRFAAAHRTRPDAQDTAGRADRAAARVKKRPPYPQFLWIRRRKRRRAALRSLLAGLVILSNPGQSRSWPAGLIFVASPRWR